MCVFGSLVEKKRRREKKIMSSKVSLLRALRRQKKEGERKARGERRRRRPIVVARTSSLRRFFRRHGVVHVPYVMCFCEDTWRKKKFFFWSTNSQKPKAIVYPPPQVSSSLSKTRKRSTKDSRPKTATRESKVSTYREVLEESYGLKKREKKEKKRDHPEKNSRILLIRDFFSRVLE